MFNPASWPRRAARAARRLHHTLAGAHIPFIYHRTYRSGLGGAPLDRLRGERVLSCLYEEGLIRRADIVVPRPASLENILLVHRQEYLRQLEEPGAVDAIVGGRLTRDRRREAVEVQRLMVGGTIQACRLALQTGDAAVHVGGGLHHASPEGGMGFCIFNDIAVAVKRLRDRGFTDPVLIVDLDLHDGNGTRAVFADDPTVYTFSIHNAPWDDTPNDAVASTAVALGTGVEDAAYLAAIRTRLPPVIAEHSPRLAIYLAGTDPATEDPLGDWHITPEGMLERDRFVMGCLRDIQAHMPIVVLMGGGYGNAAWRHSVRFFSWLGTGDVFEPADDLEVALRRFEQVQSLLGESEAPPAKNGWLDFDLTEEDLLGVTPEARANRLLGRLNHTQLVGLMERAGILDQIRGRDYPDPHVDIEPSFGLGETMRIWGEQGRSALLMELRVSNNRTLAPGMDLMWLEWLLMQNPRARFSAARPPLPGQEHPGLGILADVFAWLIIACREAGLDGVAFRSSHFHVATLARRRFRFLEPRLQIQFDAIMEATEALGLAEASHAVAAGRVRDVATGNPVAWQEATMILPVSDRLERWLEERTIGAATMTRTLPRYEVRPA
jgi:acetoin utilization deacetylase AcuC-like enzyme